MINLISSFPSNSEPREEQITILEKIQQAINNGKKYIIVQAPTGVGKSHISATIAASSRPIPSDIARLIDNYEITNRSANNDYEYEKEYLSSPSFGCSVLTVTKALQDQYSALFNDASALKGRQNYKCSVDSDFDCDFSLCTLTPSLLVKCKEANSCPLLNARREAWKSKFGVYNYSVYFNMPDFLKKRQYFICDEASELEDELVKHYSCTIDYSKLKLAELSMNKLLTNINGSAYAWLNDLSGALKEKISSVSEDINKYKKNKKVTKSLILKYRLYKNYSDSIQNILENWYKAEYITEINKDSATFTPLYVNILAQDFFKWSDTVILMSGTIIDHETYTNTLGIKREEYEYIEVDSSFDASKSPIYCEQGMRLSYSTMDAMLPKLIEKALKICKHFEHDKGIIHTHTHKITSALTKSIKGERRFLIRESGITNETILDEHYLRDDGTVLVSPSLSFGTDLKDDFGRFSIVMKAPYLPLGNERVKKLAQKNQKWYEMKCLVNLIQMCGRTTRNKDDFSDTFILDACATDLIKRNKSKLPRYFLARLQ